MLLYFLKPFCKRICYKQQGLQTIINTSGLAKTYRRYKKKEGILGSIASLRKRDFEEKTAVNSIDLSVKEYELLGLIGPNEASKTTLIKMLTGIIAGQ